MRKDLEALGWRCRQLDQCVFLKYDGDELVGVCGVYVDDFIIAGKPNGKSGKLKKDKWKKKDKWGKWEADSFTLCGVRYLQKKDYSIVMDQQGFTRKLSTAEFNLPKNLYKTNRKSKRDAAGLKPLRGINGPLQWLCTNSRVDLSAKVSLSASETSNPTIQRLQKANKIF